MGAGREGLGKALHSQIRASGRFSEVDEIEVGPGPKRAGLEAGGHRVSVTFEPTVRVADPDRFTRTVHDQFEEVFPGLRVSETAYEPPKPATGEVGEDIPRIRPARGPAVVLTVWGLEERFREPGQG